VTPPIEKDRPEAGNPLDTYLVVVRYAIATVEFEGTVHVAHAYSEGPTYQHLPAPGVEFTHPHILAVDAISEHSIISLDKREEALEVTDIELPM
jgi:hypothetical protein